MPELIAPAFLLGKMTITVFLPIPGILKKGDLIPLLPNEKNEGNLDYSKFQKGGQPPF